VSNANDDAIGHATCLPREPTPAMVTRGAKQIGWDSDDEEERMEVALLWKAMWDEAVAAERNA